MKETIQELATGKTKESDVSGSATSSTALEPAIWLKGILDAAKTRLFFTNFVFQTTLQKGQAETVIPYRNKYLGSSGVSYTTTTPAAGTGITATKLDNLDGVTIKPTMQASRVAIGNFALHSNAVDLIRAAQDELVYSVGDKVDAYVATQIGDATSSTSSTAGAQILYGGDATSDNTLATGDIMTTDLVAEARKLIMSKNKQYRATAAGNGGGYGAVQSASVVGNPWISTPDDPFVLFIGPAQEEAFLKDSQFVNAAEYGNNEIVLNGEIGRYLGVKIVVTNNVEQVASGSEGPDEETANAGATMTRCILMKGKKAAALVWGRKPKLSFFDNVPEVSQDIVLEAAYKCSVVHADAIVFIDVSDA